MTDPYNNLEALFNMCKLDACFAPFAYMLAIFMTSRIRLQEADTHAHLQ